MRTDIVGEQGHCLDEETYQAILKAGRVIAFSYDSGQKTECFTPYIGELLAGRYDGRLLSQTMLEDSVIHPADVEKAKRFREEAMQKEGHEMVLRLKTPEGEYRWFRMVMAHQIKPDGRLLNIGMLADIDERMTYQEELRRQAEYDPVSGIYHRMAFLNRAKELIERTQDGSRFLFQFDIERFKLVNELYGMEEGDNVLRYIGSVLKKLARPGELYGRLRDDVFCVCSCRSRADTVALIEQIAHEVKGYPLMFRFFLPAGIVEIGAGCRDSVSSLCDKATLAQGRVKGNYLRGYCFYEMEMGKRLNRDHLLIAGMETALRENQFEAWFQPQYDIHSGKMIGAEALARWRHPELGMLSPAEFIPLFERNGFIIKLDEYIWETVCCHIHDWLARGFSPPPISVNVSRIHLYDMNLYERIVGMCERYHVPHSLLWLEVTESDYTEQPKELIPVMKKLKQAGFQFAMDDFGSGYSSLNILKDIPVDLIKFDLRFLEGENNSGQAGYIILKNAVQLVSDLHLSSLAEGVETEQQVQFLQSIGCYHAQGYYYARPMPAADFELLLNK